MFFHFFQLIQLQISKMPYFFCKKVSKVHVIGSGAT